MSAALITTNVLAVLVGITIGLFGGGGAILMVPILTYVAGWPTEEAVTGSLFVVGITSLFSTVLHARPTKKQRAEGKSSGNVRWGTGLVFGALAMLGSFAGGQLTPLLPPTLVMTIFAAVMVGSGVGMVREGKPASSDAPDPNATRWTRSQTLKIISAALAIGVLSGLVGAGGGFLVVPALTLLVGFPMTVAVGTSLLVVSMQSASGFISHILHASVDWPALSIMAGLAMLGTIAGTILGSRVSAEKLKRAFGVFVLFMAAFVLAEEYLIG